MRVDEVVELRLLSDALLAAARLDLCEQLAQCGARAMELAVAQLGVLIVRHHHAHLVRQGRHHRLLPRTGRLALVALRLERPPRRSSRLADLGRSSIGCAGAEAVLLGFLKQRVRYG